MTDEARSGVRTPVTYDLTDAEPHVQLAPIEERFRSLVERMPAVIHISRLDETSSTVYISPRVETMLGYPPQQWLDDPSLWPRIVHPDDLEAALDDNAHHIRTCEPSVQEYRMVAHDGRVVWIHEEAVVVRDPDGNPTYSQGVMVDVTESKQAEEALRAALERERQASEQLRALDEMKDAFLVAVSHELRTPLTTILGIALTLVRDDVTFSGDETHDLLERLANNARKLDGLLSDLLDLDRLSRGLIEPKRQPVDVAMIVERVLGQTDLLRDRPLTVDAPRFLVSLDGPKVERIVENLLANTARHTPPGTPTWVRVEATTEEGATGVLVTVEDAGPGVPEELRADIFEPFHRGRDTSRSSPGVGIGLALVTRFAQIHGGRAWVEERDGGGASFKVFLPGELLGAVGTVGVRPG